WPVANGAWRARTERLFPEASPARKPSLPGRGRAPPTLTPKALHDPAQGRRRRTPGRDPGIPTEPLRRRRCTAKPTVPTDGPRAPILTPPPIPYAEGVTQQSPGSPKAHPGPRSGHPHRSLTPKALHSKAQGRRRRTLGRDLSAILAVARQGAGLAADPHQGGW